MSTRSGQAREFVSQRPRRPQAQFCIKRFRAPFHQHPNFNHEQFWQTVHTHRFCCFTCNTQIFASYGLILFAFVWIALGLYLAYFNWDVTWVILSAGGWILLLFGICLRYCGQMTAKKEVETIQEFYDTYYEDERNPAANRHNYEDDLNHHHYNNRRVQSSNFGNPNNRSTQNESGSSNARRTSVEPSAGNQSGRSNQIPSNDVVILENMYSTTLHQSQLSINMLPQYSETCEPLSEHHVDIEPEQSAQAIESAAQTELPAVSQNEPIVQIEINNQQNNVVAPTSPSSQTTVTSSLLPNNDVLSPESSNSLLTENSQEEQIYANQETICAQAQLPVLNGSRTNSLHSNHSSRTTNANANQQSTVDDRTNLLNSLDSQPDDSVTASTLAEAFNRVLREHGEEQLLLMPVASENQSPQPEVQLKVNELIQTCPEISNGFEQSELLLLGTNRTLSVDRPINRETLRRSIRRQYLYVNQDILKRSRTPQNDRCANETNDAPDRPLSAPLSYSRDDSSMLPNQCENPYLNNLLKHLFDSQQNETNLLQNEAQSDEQTALISSSDSLASTNVSDVSGNTTFSTTSSFENFQQNDTHNELTEVGIENQRTKRVQRSKSVNQSKTLRSISSATPASNQQPEEDCFGNAATLPRQFLIVDSLDQFTSTISNLSLADNDRNNEFNQANLEDADNENSDAENEDVQQSLQSNEPQSIDVDHNLSVNRINSNRLRISRNNGNEAIFGRRPKSPSNRQSRKAFKKKYKKFLLVFLTPF